MNTSFFKTFIVAFALMLCLQSCSMFSETSTQDAFIGGEIVNPVDKEIVISKDSNAIDTIKLDNKNRFYYYLPNVQPGLYSFTHGAESQIVYLEPGDSTIIYANTLEFDESLHFSGRGAEKNNFLIDMFLLNEKNNHLILSYFKTEPEAFLQKTDSLKNLRERKLEKLKKKHRFSQGFIKLASTSIDYEHYDLKERYTYLLNKYYPSLSEKIPENFHDYREEIDFNNKELENYYGYLRLIDNYLKNISIESCADSGNPKCVDSYSYTNIKRRLELIDSLTTNPNLKNKYFSRLGGQGILCTSTESQLNSIFQIFEEEEIPEEKMNSLKTLAAIQKVYLKGRILPPVKLIDKDFNEVRLNSLVRRPTVFYNWSMYSPTQNKKGHHTIKELRLKFPHVDFIGINIDTGDSLVWRNFVDKEHKNPGMEYQLQEVEIDKRFLSYFLNKLLFVNAEGKVITGNVKLNSLQLEDQLVDFLNSEEINPKAQIATSISN